jgi:hypothetical protein
LADSHVEGRPTVNGISTLKAHAMRRPLAEEPHQSRCIHARGQPQWKELRRHLSQLGIEVAAHRELPKAQEANQDHLRQLWEAPPCQDGWVNHRASEVQKLFPAITEWVQGNSHNEIGDQVTFGFVVQALDYGVLVIEDDKHNTLSEVMSALGNGNAHAQS